jgi:hypothetical protein
MPSSEALAQRVASAHRKVTQLHRQFRRGTWITAIVGILLLGLLSGYFAYGYTEISNLTKPEMLVNWVGDMVDNQIQGLANTAQSEVKAHASEWIDQACQQGIAYLPQGREQLEDVALKLTDEFVSKHTVMAEDMFRRVLKEHHGTIKDTLDQLAAKQDVSKELLAPLQAAIESELKVEMEAQAKDLLEALVEMDAKAQRLQDGANLDEGERIERRILAIVRQMYNEVPGHENLLGSGAAPQTAATKPGKTKAPAPSAKRPAQPGAARKP